MQLTLNYVLSPHSMQKAGIILFDLYAHDSEYSRNSIIRAHRDLSKKSG